MGHESIFDPCYRDYSETYIDQFAPIALYLDIQTWYPRLDSSQQDNQSDIKYTQQLWSITNTTNQHSNNMPRCQSKQLLMRGLRPSPQHKIHCSVCTRRCIFCDIWKLASLVFTHVPLSYRYSTTPEKLRSMSCEPSYDYGRIEKAIEGSFMNEQFKLQSIMSICTVEGAEESMGLRMAHDRCLEVIAQLLQEEEKLELALIRAPSPDLCYSRRPSHAQYHDHRRPSMVSMVA